MKTKVKKRSLGFIIVCFVLPAVASIVAAFLVVNPNGENAMTCRIILAVLAMVVLYVLILSFILPVFLRTRRKSFLKKCKANGCDYNHFFRGDSTLVAVDTNNRKMGILFKMNALHPYIVDLDEISDAKASNGANALSLGGTREVYFTFKLGDMKVKVRTLYANTTCSLNSSIVLEALAKADRIVEAIQG